MIDLKKYYYYICACTSRLHLRSKESLFYLLYKILATCPKYWGGPSGQWVEINGKCYIFVAGADLFHDQAHLFCEAMQAKVVEPQSISQNQAISAAFDRTACNAWPWIHGCTDYWIGVHNRFGLDQ